MSSQLPVPSKAALTALRGLVLGTSCTLALVAEDRRRRIKNALQVIENGDRIKSARNYRAGAEAVVVALEEEVTLEGRNVSSYSLGHGQHHCERSATLITAPRKISSSRVEDTPRVSWNGAAHELSQEGHVVHQEATGTADSALDGRALSRSHVPEAISRIRKTKPFMSLPKKPAKSSWAGPLPVTKGTRASVSPLTFPKSGDIISQIHDVCGVSSAQTVGPVVRLVLQAYDYEVAPGNSDGEWMKASAQLCRACLDVGQVSDAARILLKVITRGPLEESDYFLHDPVRLIKSLVSQCEDAPVDSRELKLAAMAKFDTAVDLYLATFTRKPGNEHVEYAELGRRLLGWAFTVQRGRRLEDIYWRCFASRQLDSVDITEFFIQGLRKVHEPKLAIKIFRVNYTKLEPTAKSLAEVGETMVHCVQEAHNYQAGPVLKALQKLCAGSATSSCFRPTWAMKLLDSVYKRNKDLGQVDHSFREFISSDAGMSMQSLDGCYRVMIQVALGAGNHCAAESYFDELCQSDPKFATEILVLGMFALAKAKAGDWEGVRSDFEAMRVDGSGNSKRELTQVFVPILKVYMKEHTFSETEEFIRFYVDDLNVLPDRYMLTLLATHYAKIRDVEAFLGWLRYCTAAGFEMHSSLGNAILTNCAKHWGFSLHDLRKTYMTLKKTSPESVDRYTERFMANAALWLPNSSKSPAHSKARLTTLRIRRDRYPLKGKIADPNEVFLAMKEAVELRNPVKAIRIYKTALHHGMPYKWYIFAQAVKAGLAISNEVARRLIREMHEKGENVTQALHYDLIKRLRTVDSTQEQDDVLRLVNAILSEYQSFGLEISAEALDRAARICLRVGAKREAVNLALDAASIKGQLCHDVYNFTTLLQAYTALADTRAVQEVAAKALASDYKVDLLCLKGLKKTRGQLTSFMKNLPWEIYNKLLSILSDAIKEVVQARREFAGVSQVVGEEVLSILKQATLDNAASKNESTGEDHGSGYYDKEPGHDAFANQPDAAHN